jgi:hypothetical protein
VNSLFVALRAKLSFLRHMMLAISLREIASIMCLKAFYSAAEGGKNLFAQSPIQFLFNSYSAFCKKRTLE